LEGSVLYNGKLSNLTLTIDSTLQVKLEIRSTIVRNAAHGVAADNRFFVMHQHRTAGERDGNLSGVERDGDSLAFVRSQEDGGKTDAPAIPGRGP